MSWSITIYPSAYRNQVAIYDQVRPVASNAPTGLTLHAGEETKTWTDEFGVEQSHVASHTYLPAVAGTRHTLTTSVHVATYGTRTYTQTIEWSNRLGGPWTWKTKIDDSVGPTTFELSWLLIDGDHTPANGGLGLPGTGAGVQIVERYAQRWSENDAYANTYKHDNPTQNGAGQSLQQDTDGPFASYFDPFTNLRCYGPLLLDYRVPSGTGDYFNAGFKFVDFGGDGSAATSTLGHTPHELYESPESPAVWGAKLGNQRIDPNWGGLATSAMIQRIQYWTYGPIAHDQTGVQGPNLASRDTHNGFRPRYFTKAYVVDLAVGASSPLDVDTLSAQPFAYDGSAVFIPEWTVTMREVLLLDKNGDSNGVVALQLSPYKAVVVYNPVTNFAIALATKLQDVDDDGAFEGATGHLGTRMCGAPAYLNIGQFITSATVGLTDEGFSTRLTANCKSVGGRPRGWIGHSEFLVIGTLLDVRDALDELYSSGSLDADLDIPPPTVTAGTIPPGDTTMPTPVGTANIVFITGNSQCCVGSDDMLRADRNPQLCKLPEQDPLRSDRPIRTTDSRAQMWNQDLRRWEMLQHNANSSGWGASRGDQFGFETSLHESLLRRDIDNVFFIKCAGASTTLGRDLTAPGNWNGSDARVTVTATVTVTPTGTGATIVGPAGTFSGITAPCYVSVTGSQFIVGAWSCDNYLSCDVWKIPGVFARSGNNTYEYKPMPVESVSTDGSTITVGKNPTAGVPLTWHAETRDLTFKFGPEPLRAAAEATVTEALRVLRYDLRLEPVPLMTVNNAGENDRNMTRAEFRDALRGHIQWMRRTLGIDETNAQCAPHAEVQMGPNLHGATDDQIEGIRKGCREAVDLSPNAYMVPVDDLPVSFELGETIDAPWPPASRQDNGTHLTSSAILEVGWRIEQAMDRFPWFPSRTYATEINPSGQQAHDPRPHPTLASIRTAVKRRWERDGSGIDVRDSVLTEHVNAALREVYAFCGDEAWFLRQTQDVVCNYPPDTTTMPSDVVRVYRVERPNLEGTEIEWSFIKYDDQGRCVIMTRQGGTLRIHHHVVPADLAADDDAVAFTVEHEEVVAVLAVRRLASYSGNEGLARQAAFEGDRLLKEMKRDCMRYGRMQRPALSTASSRVEWGQRDPFIP